MSQTLRTFALACLFGLASCGAGGNRDPISASVIGKETAILRQATMQGLVALDTGGSVVPALAERWIVTDNGLSYIFRIREATWPDGQPVTADDVAASLRQGLAQTRGVLRPMSGNVAAVIPMTGRVVELRLKRAQPILLRILAQPDLAILRKSQGTGPYFIHSKRNGVTRLRPVASPGMEALGEVEARETSANDVRVRGERAEQAVARFRLFRSSLVMGGTLADLPLAQAAGFGEDRLKIEPARGVFGLVVANPRGPLQSIRLRRALSLALDRARLPGLFSLDDWPLQTVQLPTRINAAANGPDSQALGQTLDTRVIDARILAGSQAITLSVALPEGPGMRILFAALARDWQRIGVRLIRSAPSELPDLRLVDDVAPVNTPVWYVAKLGCRYNAVCDPGSDALLQRAILELDPAQRLAILDQAESAATATYGFIPIGRPIRWSLVQPQLTVWKASPIAHHPLDRLRPIVR